MHPRSSPKIPILVISLEKSCTKYLEPKVVWHIPNYVLIRKYKKYLKNCVSLSYETCLNKLLYTNNFVTITPVWQVLIVNISDEDGILGTKDQGEGLVSGIVEAFLPCNEWDQETPDVFHVLWESSFQSYIPYTKPGTSPSSRNSNHVRPGQGVQSLYITS